ncbi:MAG: hypothetical protein JWO67_3347 [Streptosporangiaceae bacterium]|nr:hypothetical protein [Streptosporangiaceae bacterium]
MGPVSDVIPQAANGGVERPVAAARPLAVTGIVAAAWCVGIGLAVLTTVTLIGWIAAPRTALGPGLPGVFRTAVNFWLVAHHAGFSLKVGRVGMLPLGLMVLPGALLYRSGGWVIRVTEVRGRQRIGVMQVAVALAAPYAILAGMLALTARSPVVTPSAWQAVLAGFLLALFAGGLGAARAIVAARGKRVRSGLGALLRLLPDRPRSLVVGVVGATAVLLGSGALLAAISLAIHLSEAKASYVQLAPGIVGGFLLLLVELAFLPNAVIWGMAYAIGPGFAVGSGTSVSPTGVFIDAIPLFPPLSALPEPGPAPALSLFALAAPFVAGAVGGTFTIRAMPSPVYEAAPLWGFLSGALTGWVAAVLAALSGGPLGGGRLAIMGPSAWQVGLLAALEVGVSAAIAAWVTNWALLRRAITGDKPAKPPTAPKPSRSTNPRKAAKSGRQAAKAAKPGQRAAPSKPAAKPPAPAPNPVEFVDPEPMLSVRVSRRSGGDGVPAEPREVRVPRPRAEPAVAEPATPATPRATAPPQEELGKVETRGGAIYVLKSDPPD